MFFVYLITKAEPESKLLHQSCQLFLLHLAVIEDTLSHPGQLEEHHTTVDTLALARQAKLAGGMDPGRCALGS